MNIYGVRNLLKVTFYSPFCLIGSRGERGSEAVLILKHSLWLN